MMSPCCQASVDSLRMTYALEVHLEMRLDSAKSSNAHVSNGGLEESHESCFESGRLFKKSGRAQFCSKVTIKSDNHNLTLFCSVVYCLVKEGSETTSMNGTETGSR